MDQQKSKSLKKRLESLNYHQPFTSESISLIEALLSDLSFLNKSYQHLKSESQSLPFLNQKLDQLAHENYQLKEELKNSKFSESNSKLTENLNNEIFDLRKENNLLSQQLQAIQIGKNDYKSNEYLDKLFDECNILRKRLDESEENCRKLLYENSNLQDRLENSEYQINSLKKELELTKGTVNNITNENKSKTEEFYSLKQLVSSYESKYSLIKSENNSLRMDIQRLMNLNNGLEQQLSDLGRENLKNRDEIDQISDSKIKINSQFESIQRQCENFQIENNKLHSINQENTKNLLEQESKYRELHQGYDELKSKLRVLYKENQILSEKVNEKDTENRNKEYFNKGLEKEIQDLKVYLHKFEENQLEIKKLKEALDQSFHESKKIKQENLEIQNKLKYKEEDLINHQNYLEKSNREIESLKKNLAEEYSKNESLSVYQRNNILLEDQLSSLKKQLDECIYREQITKKDLGNLKVFAQKSEEKLEYYSKLVDNANFQRSGLEEENSRLQLNLNELISRENSKNTEISRLDNKLQHAYAEIDEMKRLFNKNINEINSLQDDLKDFQKKYISEQNFVSKQADQIGKLKDYIYSLEQNKVENLKKIENLQNIEQDQQIFIQKAKDETNSIRKQLSMSERICNEGIAEKEKMISEINTLKYDNNRKNDEIVSLKNSLKIYMKETEDLKSKSETTYENENNYKRSLRESNIENSRLFEINTSLNSQIEEHKKVISKLNSDIQDLSNQIRVKECEIKKHEDYRKVLSYENNLLTSKFEENNKELRHKSDLGISISRENDDIKKKHKELIEEYNRLLRAYEYLETELTKTGSQFISIENSKEAFKTREENYIKTIKDLEEQLKFSLRKSNLGEYQFKEAEKKTEFFSKEFKNYNIREFDSNIEDLQRKLTSLENEKSYYANRCREIEAELFHSKSELEFQQNRLNELETRLSNEKDGLRKQEIQEEKAKFLKQSSGDLISELYKQIEAYKSESVSLEMKYLKLIDEFSKTKSQLHQAEMKISDLEISRR